MTTARDLMIVALEEQPGSPVEQGDLSLALAGAEVLDLLDAKAITVDGDRVVPEPHRGPDDSLLAEAVAALDRQKPYETVEEWLWRRGRGLAARYLAALEEDGEVERRSRWMTLRAERPVLTDSGARRRARERWASHDPVLTHLAAAAGVRREPAQDGRDIADDRILAVLAAVGDAVVQLEAVRQQKTVEEAAFDNVWRGGGD